MFKASQSIYTYKAKLVRVIDADTIEAIIDMGFKHEWKTIVRFVGFDAYEMRGAQVHPRGKEATESLTSLFRLFAYDGLFYLRTDRDQIVIYNRVAGWPYLQVDTPGDASSVYGFADVVATMKARGWDKRDIVNFDSFDPDAQVIIKVSDISEVPDPRVSKG